MLHYRQTPTKKITHRGTESGQRLTLFAMRGEHALCKVKYFYLTVA